MLIFLAGSASVLICLPGFHKVAFFLRRFRYGVPHFIKDSPRNPPAFCNFLNNSNNSRQQTTDNRHQQPTSRFNTNPQIPTRISISARLATRIPTRGTKKTANFCTTSNLSQSVSNGSPGHCGDLRATANHQHPQHQQQQHQKEGRQKTHFFFKGVEDKDAGTGTPEG